MFDIVVLGLNHKTADIALRECLAFSPVQAEDALGQFRTLGAIDELILISTCNRVELVFTTQSSDTAIHDAKKRLAVLKNIPVADFDQSLYQHVGDDAVRHLYRVAASLDSMVVGEPQILGQIKDAYLMATQKKTSGVILNRLMHKTFSIAKRVRTETGIGDHAVSIAYAAIELAKKIFGSLEGKPVLLIGAGEMAELAVEHLIRNRCGEIRVANRTLKRGIELAERFNGKALTLAEIPDHLIHTDIVISSTGAPGLVINRNQVKSVMKPRRNRPIFFIDIAVPRDIDPEINNLSNAYVYDIDDLKGVVDDNVQDRRKEAVKADRIIDEAVIQFRYWMESLDVVPTIVALHQRLESIAEMEMKKTLPGLQNLTADDAGALQRMTQAMINKFLHDPTTYLKRNGCMGNRSLHLDVTRKLFNLDPE